MFYQRFVLKRVDSFYWDVYYRWYSDLFETDGSEEKQPPHSQPPVSSALSMVGKENAAVVGRQDVGKEGVDGRGWRGNEGFS